MRKLLTVMLALVMLLSICTGALTLDSAEDAVEATEEAVATVQADELDIPLYDPTYGKLVYYNNFESQELGADATGTYYTYCNTSFIDATNAPVKVAAINPVQIVEDPVNGNGNKVVKVINEATGRQFTQFWLSNGGDFTAVGTYTVVFDVTASANIPIKLRHHEDGAAGSAVTVLTTTANKWSTGAKSIDLLPYAERDNGSYTVKNGWMHTDYTVSESNIDDASFYIDNLRIYYLPKGYVTTEALNIPTKADGTPETVYQTPANNVTPAAVTFDATTKKYVSVKDTYYIPGYAFLGWYDADGNKYTPETFTLSGTHSPKAMYGRWQKLGPGLNIFTGTTEPADFENGSTNNIGFRFNASNIGIRTVVDNSVELGGTGNTTRVLKTKGIWTYHHMFLPGVFEGGRQYEIKYDAYYSAAPLGKISTFNSWIINTGSTIDHTQYGNTAENKAGKWYSGTQTVTPKNSVDYLEIQTKISKDSPTADVTDYTYQNIYFDNMSVMPYYKVTYKALDGSDLKTEWLLRDAEGNVLTSYTPDAELSIFWNGEGNKLFAGWSTTLNDTSVVESVVLANADVVLYPVFVDVDYYAINDVASAKTGATTEITFTKAVNADLTTVITTTGATAAWTADNKCTVTGGGYAGEMTFNLVFADETTATETVKLLGGDKWKPGLNIITGTAEAFDFEGYTAEEIAYAVNLYNNAVVTENPKNDGYNTSAAVAKYTGSEFPGLSVSISQTIEKGRSLFMMYDYKGTWNSCVWLLANGGVYANFAGQMTKNAEDWKHSRFYFVDNSKADFTSEISFQIKLPAPFEENALYVDNVAFIPAYKFTYVDVDGTESIVYAIHDEAGNLLTSYTPDGAKFASGVTSYKLEGNDTVYSINTPIALANEDVVIYAVADAEIPGTVESQEMRFDIEGEKVTSSIRFKGFVSTSVQNKSKEYGFIATRKTFLTTMTEKAEAGEDVETELTFDLKYNERDLFVYGAAYECDENGEVIVNKSVGDDDDGNIVFAAVLTGIDNSNAEQVNEVLVARPYVKYVNGDKEFVFYGEVAENSLVGVAKNVDTANLPAKEKSSIEAIIALEK